MDNKANYTIISATGFEVTADKSTLFQFRYKCEIAAFIGRNAPSFSVGKLLSDRQEFKGTRVQRP